MPLDIAVVSDTSPSTSGPFSGKLTLLFNDGQGGFTVGATPGAHVCPQLDRARPAGCARAARPIFSSAMRNANRFLFLVNIGRPGTFRLPVGPSQGFFDGAGDFDALLVGNVAHGGANPLDDVITFDRRHDAEDLRQHRARVVRSSAPSRPGTIRISPARSRRIYSPTSAAAPSGLPHRWSRGGQISLLLLQGDGAGGFTPATGEVPLEAVARDGDHHVQDHVCANEWDAGRVVQRGHLVPADRGRAISQQPARQQQARFRVRHQGYRDYRDGWELPGRQHAFAAPGESAAPASLPRARQ